MCSKGLWGILNLYIHICLSSHIDIHSSHPAPPYLAPRVPHSSSSSDPIPALPGSQPLKKPKQADIDGLWEHTNRQRSSHASEWLNASALPAGEEAAPEEATRKSAAPKKIRLEREAPILGKAMQQDMTKLDTEVDTCLAAAEKPRISSRTHSST